MTIFTAGQMTALAQKAGFDAKTAQIMGAIGMAESGGDSKAHNIIPPDNSYGLWQINMLGSMGPARRKMLQISKNEDLYIPAINALAAKKIHSSQGLSAWSTYTNGAYKKYLKDAGADKELLEELNKNPMESSPVGEALDDAVSAVSWPSNVVEAVGKAGNWVSDPQNWIKVAYIVGGGILVIAGLVVMAGPRAAQVLPTGKALKAVKKVTS